MVEIMIVFLVLLGVRKILIGTVPEKVAYLLLCIGAVGVASNLARPDLLGKPMYTLAAGAFVLGAITVRKALDDRNRHH